MRAAAAQLEKLHDGLAVLLNKSLDFEEGEVKYRHSQEERPREQHRTAEQAQSQIEELRASAEAVQKDQPETWKECQAEMEIQESKVIPELEYDQGRRK